MPKIVPRSMERYGKTGWTWRVKDISDEPLFTSVQNIRYRTNEDGEGLWKVGTYRGNEVSAYSDRQIEGTVQFSLPNDYDRARYRIKKYFKEG